MWDAASDRDYQDEKRDKPPKARCRVCGQPYTRAYDDVGSLCDDCVRKQFRTDVGNPRR